MGSLMFYQLCELSLNLPPLSYVGRNSSYLCENLAHDLAIATHTQNSRQTCPVASPVDTRLASYEMKLFESYFELLMVLRDSYFEILPVKLVLALLPLIGH
jgi:hypothetical protein